MLRGRLGGLGELGILDRCRHPLERDRADAARRQLEGRPRRRTDRGHHADGGSRGRHHRHRHDHRGDPLSAATTASSLVEAAGGRIDGRTETAAANGEAGSATLVLRIPAAKVTATIDALKKLGRADQIQLASADVTSQTQDLDARITAARTTIARLLQLESTATDTTNLIAIETAIGDRQGELESMEAQQRGLADQIAMSTITLALRSPAAAPAIKPADFWSGLGTGWSGFVAFWATVLVALGVLIPWLVLAAAATATTLLTRRSIRRRRRGATSPAPIG